MSSAISCAYAVHRHQMHVQALCMTWLEWCLKSWHCCEQCRAGGTALAQKLVDIYFTLFKLILEGKLGHGSELSAAREAKAQAKHRKPGKRGPSEQGHAKPLAAANKGPSSVDQVTYVFMLSSVYAPTRLASSYSGRA